MDQKTGHAGAATTSVTEIRIPEATAVARAIAHTGRFQSHPLDVSSHDGIVTIRGRVATYYQKQIAQTAALAVVGVGRLRNEVEVA
jgi:osmotically-inducible protein OsmY